MSANRKNLSFNTQLFLSNNFANFICNFLVFYFLLNRGIIHSFKILRSHYVTIFPTLYTYSRLKTGRALHDCCADIIVFVFQTIRIKDSKTTRPWVYLPVLTCDMGTTFLIIQVLMACIILLSFWVDFSISVSLYYNYFLYY